MRRVITGFLLTVSLAGAGFEIVSVTRPEWFADPLVASMTDLDPGSRVGTFRFADELLRPIYVRIPNADMTVTENDQVSIQSGADRVAFPLKPGAVISIENRDYRVVEIRPWVGLLPDPEGHPMVSLSVASESGEWVENLFLKPTAYLELESIRFRLYDSITSVVDFVQARGEQNTPGRWGVREGERIHWFENLAPGSGVDLDDGSRYTLLRFNPHYSSPEGEVPAILVRREKDGESQRLIVTAETNHDPVTLELTRYPQAWLLRTPDGEIEAVLYQSESSYERRSLKIGIPATFESAPLSLRLEQYLSEAVPVNLEQTSFLEAVLESDAGQIRVRQGEAVRVGDSLLRYQRVLPSGAIYYDIAHSFTMEDTRRLREGQAIRVEIDESPYKLRHTDIDFDYAISLYPIPAVNRLRLAAFFAIGLLATLIHLFWRRARASTASGSS